jgi:hypothetical protein
MVPGESSTHFAEWPFHSEKATLHGARYFMKDQPFFALNEQTYHSINQQHMADNPYGASVQATTQGPARKISIYI